VELAERTDARMVYVEIDGFGSNIEIGDGIDTVEEGHRMPRGIEGSESSRIVCSCVLVSLARNTTKCLPCLLGSHPLDEIGNE